MDAGEGIGLLTTAFGLSKRQQRLILQIGWIVIVTTHIAWACGWLASLGLVGFVKADDFREVQQTVETSARVTISREIREQAMIRCRVSDPVVAESITRYIDGLQAEYERITKARLVEPPCPPLGTVARGAP
jgi:hypothetical protein